MSIVDNNKNEATSEITKDFAGSESSSLTDRAFSYIRKAIYDGVISPGGRLNELEISQKLGISRGPIREAIRRMSSSGLVIYEPNAGARVVSLTAENVAQLYDVREALEAKAASRAAVLMTAQEREALITTLDAHKAQMTDDNSASYPRGGADWDFHLLILKGARNEVIWRICGDELRDLFSLLRIQHESNPGRGQKALEEHRWIGEAIVAGNADLASLLMAHHIRSSRDNLLSAMEAASQRAGISKLR